MLIKEGDQVFRRSIKLKVGKAGRNSLQSYKGVLLAESKKESKKDVKKNKEKSFRTPERLRFSVYRSLNHIYAQIIDDFKGHTIVSASSLDKELKDKKSHKGNMKQQSRLESL